MVFLTIARLPPKNSAAGVEPRVTAFAGTFILMLFVFLPSGSNSTVLQLVAAFLIVTGTSLSVACVCWLGRSFSIMATARRLVIRGPYAFIRHPLYAAEAVTALGLVLSRWSVFALMIGAAWFALQYRRSVNEEAILRATFPEYDEYAKGVPRFFPTGRKISRLMKKAQDTA
jgi:protein-S-isoprenylcysteine O-methyltransferase Ste14